MLTTVTRIEQGNFSSVTRTMPLTKDFQETVRARLIRSAGVRQAVLQEAIDGLRAHAHPAEEPDADARKELEAEPPNFIPV